MRALFLLPALFFAGFVQAQAGWLPLSREVERPYATALERYGSDAHTAIRPYLMREINALPGVDSLRPAAAIAALDRWSGARNGRKFRWGPLLDASAGLDAGSDEAMRYRAGAGFWMDLDASEKLSFHLDAQGWSQRFVGYLDTLVRSTQVSPGQGYAYGDAPNYAHYDVNGYVSWDPGKFFNLTLGKGRNSFGEGHRSLMLSDEAYSYPFLRITTSVWKVRYVNLFARMSDIRGAAGSPDKNKGKYTSMHYLSWNVSRRVNVSIFEAVVWNSGDSLYPRGFDLNYLNPVIFYRPVEFNIGSPDNALLGAGLSVKIGKHTLIYSQLMLDEFVLREVRSGFGWYANKQAVQLGVIARNALKVPGLSVRAEWNFIRPFMYTHSDTRQNYAHFGQPLAHPFGSNVQEAILHVERDRGRWSYGLRSSMAWMGTDTLESYGNNIFRPESDRPVDAVGNPVNYGYELGNLEVATLFHGELRAGYLIDPASATRIEVSYLYRNASRHLGAPEAMNYINLGVVCHFRQRYPEQQTRYVLP